MSRCVETRDRYGLPPLRLRDSLGIKETSILMGPKPHGAHGQRPVRPPQGTVLAELQCNKALNHYLDVALAHHNLPSLESGLCMAKPDAPPPARLSRTLIHHLRERVTRRSSRSRLLFGITLAVMPGTEEKASRRSSSPPIGLILFQEAIKVSLFIV
jgi:hypothetical protein